MQLTHTSSGMFYNRTQGTCIYTYLIKRVKNIFTLRKTAPTRADLHVGTEQTERCSRSDIFCALHNFGAHS